MNKIEKGDKKSSMKTNRNFEQHRTSDTSTGGLCNTTDERWLSVMMVTVSCLLIPSTNSFVIPFISSMPFLLDVIIHVF